MNHIRRLSLISGSVLLAVGLTALWLTSAQAAKLPPSADLSPSRPEAPPARGNHSLTAVGGNLYLFGGSSITSSVGTRNDLWRFEPNDDTWHSVSITGTGPAGRSNHAATALNNQLYILGGNDAAGNKLDDIWRYDPATGKWSMVHQETPLPARSDHTAVTYNGQLMVYGGKYDSHALPASIWRFDPASGYWSYHGMGLENPQGNSYGHTAGVIGDKMYIIGGGTSSTDTPIMSYNFSTSSFQSVTSTIGSPRPMLRRDHAGVFRGNQIYIFGGSSITGSLSGKGGNIFGATAVTGDVVLQDAWMFDLVAHEWTRLPDLPEPLSGAEVEILPGEELELLIVGGFSPTGEAAQESYVFDGSTYEEIKSGISLFLPIMIQK